MRKAEEIVPVRTDKPVPDTEVMRLLKLRGTVRQFKSDPIPDSWVRALIEAAQRAPTSSNLQSYSIIAVRNAEIKAKLAELGGNQQHIIDCPVFFALCADMARPSYVCKLHGKNYPARYLEAGLVASIDASLAAPAILLELSVTRIRSSPLLTHSFTPLPV